MFRKKAPDVPLPRPCAFTKANIISDIEALTSSDIINEKGNIFSHIPSRNEPWRQQISGLIETSNTLKEKFNKTQDLHEALLIVRDEHRKQIEKIESL